MSTLAELVTLARGTTYESRLLNHSGPVLLGLASIAPNGGFRRASLKTYGGDSPARITLGPGDIYVSLKDVTQSGDLLGAVARVPTDVPAGRLTQDTVRLVLKPGVSGDFLYWVLRTPQYRDFCRAHATGTTNLGLPREDFLSFPMPKASKERQRLVDLLGVLDDKMELNRRMNGTLEALVRVSYQRLARTATAQASIYDFATVAYGAPFASALFNGHREGLPLIRIRDLATFEPEMWTAEGHPRATVIEPGDLVVGMDGEFRAQIWLGARSLLNQRVCSFRPKPGVPLPFVWQAIRDDLAFYEQAKTGTTVIHLGKADIDRFTVPAPAPPELASFGLQTEPLVAKLVANAQESQTLAELRDTLLPKLISGELRGRDAESAVESAG